MDQQITSLVSMSVNARGKIVEIQGGQGFRQKLEVMGIRIGKTITLVSRQPFRGPLTIKIGGTQMTLGMGMAQKILVEVMS